MKLFNFILNLICLVIFPITFIFGIILFRNDFSKCYKVGKVYFWFTKGFGKKYIPVLDILI